MQAECFKSACHVEQECYGGVFLGREVCCLLSVKKPCLNSLLFHPRISQTVAMEAIAFMAVCIFLFSLWVFFLLFACFFPCLLMMGGHVLGPPVVLLPEYKRRAFSKEGYLWK